MERVDAILLAALLLSFGAGLPAQASGAHVHGDSAAHESLQGPVLRLDGGRQWATDEALRGHMEGIRDELARRRDAIAAGRLERDDARALGLAIERRVAGILTDCRLEPQADANLHLIVADLVAAADVLQGKSKRPVERGAHQAVRAAQMYATYLAHPGWTPVY